jgi:hypothetical protein
MRERNGNVMSLFTHEHDRRDVLLHLLFSFAAGSMTGPSSFRFLVRHSIDRGLVDGFASVVP